MDVRKEGDRILLTFAGTTLPDSLLKRLDVTDFATPVNLIEAGRTPSGARVSIAAKLPFEELAYQSDNQFTVEVAPVVKAAVEAKPTLFSADREYTGERLTLSFQDIETRAVLQLLADVSGRNIVVSDTVQGNVTLRLQNVPWDQALDIVLATKGLDMRENGGVIIVAPADEIAAREKADLEARKEIRELEPLLSEYVQVNYAKASDLAELMKGSKGNSLLSERGSVGIDERTNTLLVQDVAERIAEIRRLVGTLDIPVRQVLIESRIVIVRDDFSRDLGIRWGVTAVKDTSRRPARRHRLRLGHQHHRQFRRRQHQQQRPAVPGRAAGAGRPLQRQPADRQPGRPAGPGPAGRRLPRGSRAVGPAGRRPGRGRVLAAGDHGQPEGSLDPPGRRDSLPGSGLQRRHDDPVQGGGAEPHGDAADHSGRPDHPGPAKSPRTASAPW